MIFCEIVLFVVVFKFGNKIHEGGDRSFKTHMAYFIIL